MLPLEAVLNFELLQIIAKVEAMKATLKLKKNESRREEHRSVYQEVFVIKAYSELNLAKGSKNERIYIYSYSQATLKAINLDVTISRLVLKCRKTLEKLSGENRVHVFWMPVNSGIQGNAR
ncbi:hypothetical protein KM043_016115 [Ampulex compressa]|nr:hypothetical protein KM043_016115 [Ampulex compressa]